MAGRWYGSTYSQLYHSGVAIAIVTVAELRARLADVLERLQHASAPLYVTQRGQARAVLLPVNTYETLLDQLEFLDDSLEALRAKERREGGRERAEPLETVIGQLRKRGRVSR